jgi:sulfatase maturation enzyme AslB (radical SAM superfamily)
MCHPSLSSSWYANYIEIYGENGKRYLNSMKVLDDNAIAKFSDEAIAKLEHMNVAGGEPFITADFFRLLDRISDEQAQRMTINVTTNLSTLFYKRKNVIDMLSRFKTINIQASVDGYGEIGEYQRTGFSSQKFFNNLDMLTQMSKKYRHISVNLEYTVTTLNMFHIHDFIEYIEANTPIRHSAINFHWAVGPLGFCPGIIPDELKDKLNTYILSKVRGYAANTQNNFTRFLNWVNKPSEEHLKITYSNEGEFMIKKLDEINKTNYKDLFPWLDDILIYQKKLTKKLSVI